MDFQSSFSEFVNQGFVVIKDFLDLEDVEALKQECSKLVKEMNPHEHHSVFQTGKNQVGDDYFLNSGNKIAFFFEKDAMNEKGELVVDKMMSLNKIGHALHWWNPVFRKVSFSPRIKDLLRCFGYKDPVLVQSMFIFKHPQIGGEVVPHQDSTYLRTEPLSALGLWFPLEDATEENGCLYFVPGSHKGPVHQQFIRNPTKQPLLVLRGTFPTPSDDCFAPVPAKKGDCVVIHGSVIHKSEKNLSSKPRPVYTFHVVEKKDTQYSSENWLQPSSDLPFPSVYKE